MISYSKRLEDKKYNVNDVRDIFNAIGQRESANMGLAEGCLHKMAAFDSMLYEQSQFKQMFRNFSDHKKHDFDYAVTIKDIRGNEIPHFPNNIKKPYVLADENTASPEIVFDVARKSDGKGISMG